MKVQPEIHTSKHPKWCCQCQTNQALSEIIKQLKDETKNL